MTSRNMAAMSMAVIAGLMLMMAGINGLGMWETIRDFVTAYIIDHLAVQILFMVLIFIASLGGISVIAGGLLIGKGRITTGKLIIGLGAGMGLIGLAVSVLVDYVSGSFSIMNYYSAGWIGLILSIAARMAAKKPGKPKAKPES